MANIEEDDDFNLFPGGKSRLSNLFPTQNADESDVNQSLIYVPPKQPKKNDGTQSGSEHLKLLHAIAAYTYKLENGEYKSKGRYGVAILGDHEKYVYKLLIYKGKQQSIAMCTIHPNFKFTVELNNYAKFPDDKGDEWSITFNSEQELIDFAKQVAVAKANSFGKNFSALVVQDLEAGDGSIAEAGIGLEISFTGSLFKNFGIGEVFNNSASEGKRVVVELGKATVPKCWQEGLIGAKKGLRRLIIVPPSFGSDVGNLPDLVTPNDILIFEIYVHKIRRSRERSYSPSENKNRTEKKPEVPPRTQSVSSDVRSRGASLSEQLTQSPRKDIISRIAKIGGTNLLGMGVQPPSEVEPEKEMEPEQLRVRHPSSPSPKRTLEYVFPPPGAEKKSEQDDNAFLQPRLSLQSPGSAVIPFAHNSTVSYVQPQVSSDSIQFIHQPYVGHPHMIPALMPPAVPSLMDNHLPLLVAETRTQNTEMRLTLGKVCDKVDMVIQKIDDLKQNQGNNQVQAPYMESVVLGQNIERIVQENIQMKASMETKNFKIQELNEKICGLLESNQRFFQESNSIMEQRSNSMLSSSTHFQNQIQDLQHEKERLSLELKESISKSSHVDSKFSDFQKQVFDLKESLRVSEEKNATQKELIDSLIIKNNENETLVRSLRKTVQDTELQKEKSATELRQVQDKLSSSENSRQHLEMKMDKDSESGDLIVKEQIKTLQEGLQKALEYKKKYEMLNENSRHMKTKYETLIKDLRATASQVIQPPSSDFSSEIRKVMNKLYKVLQNEIDNEHSYSGVEVLQVCLSVIKRITFSALGKGQVQVDNANVKERSQSEKSLKEDKPENVMDRSQSEKNFKEDKSANVMNTTRSQLEVDSKKKQLEKSAEDSQVNEHSKESSHSTEIFKESSQPNPNLKNSAEVQSTENLPKNVQSQKNNGIQLDSSTFSSGDNPIPGQVDEHPTQITPSSSGETPDPVPDICDGKEPILAEKLLKDTPKSSSMPEVSNLTTGVAQSNVTIADTIKEENAPSLGNSVRSDAVKKPQEQKVKIPTPIEIWRPQPSPPPLFDEEDESDEDDWLK